MNNYLWQLAARITNINTNTRMRRHS